jgi:hypothetical protein
MTKASAAAARNSKPAVPLRQLQGIMVVTGELSQVREALSSALSESL